MLLIADPLVGRRRRVHLKTQTHHRRRGYLAGPDVEVALLLRCNCRLTVPGRAPEHPSETLRLYRMQSEERRLARSAEDDCRVLQEGAEDNLKR